VENLTETERAKALDDFVNHPDPLQEYMFRKLAECQKRLGTDDPSGPAFQLFAAEMEAEIAACAHFGLILANLV
jgi:hypothetical protein